MRRLALSMRHRAIRKLLAGNDTACFTTEQYREAFHANYADASELTQKAMRRVVDYDLARVHLVGEGKFRPSPVREVRPDVWAMKESGG